MRSTPLQLLILIAAAAFISACDRPAVDGERRAPNVILVLADDLGYGDLGAYGQERLQTPNIDRLAQEGLRFTQFYGGSTVCAPSRAVLVAGRSVGSNPIRGNREIQPMGQTPMPDSIVTVAEVLQDAGYATALVGKWGLGGPGSEGVPNRQGFDTFVGYLGQRHAHNYYPEFLFWNDQRVELPGNRLPEPKRGDGAGEAVDKAIYSHDVLADTALAFIERNKDEPFFLFLSLTIPHANNEAGPRGMEVPEIEPYVDETWPEPEQGFASMITRMDRDVGRLVAKLEELGIDDDTILFFSSDNGPHSEGGHDPDFFNSNGPLRGIKRDLYEGGIRVPMIVWGPGRVPPGGLTDHVGYFGDFLRTAAEVAAVDAPAGAEGISFLPTILGETDQPAHDFLYWEFYEGGSAQAVRAGEWKAVRRPMFTGPIELYNLGTDVGETQDISAAHPDVVARMDSLMNEAHVPSPMWTLR